MYPVGPSPHITEQPYHKYFGNNIIDNELKSSIFDEVNALWRKKGSAHRTKE
jgi:hypothetical protein